MDTFAKATNLVAGSDYVDLRVHEDRKIEGYRRLGAEQGEYMSASVALVEDMMVI